MSILNIQDADTLLLNVAAKPQALIGFFGGSSPVSEAARDSFTRFAESHAEVSAFALDVHQVKSLHQKYGVTAVPTIVRVKEGKVVDRVVGMQTTEEYERILLREPTLKGASDGKASPSAPKHSVRVYSTDTCPWCVRVKTYLRQNAIAFSDVNVGRDDNAAREMVRRSGQQGVPQLDIDGTMVVGFDKPRIDRLLGITAL